RDRLPDDFDPLLFDHVGVTPVAASTLAAELAVRSSRIRRQERPRALRSPVEAPDCLDRAVPEFGQPLAVLIRHLLPDIHRRRSARLVVDPGEWCPDVF